MATSRSVLPEPLTAVLALRATSTEAPAEVVRVLGTIPFFGKKHTGGAPTHSRFDSAASSGGGSGGGGRFQNFRSSRPAPTISEDGFETYTGGRRHRGGGGGGGSGGPSRGGYAPRSTEHGHSHSHGHGHGAYTHPIVGGAGVPSTTIVRPTPVPPTVTEEAVPVAAAEASPLFSSSALRSTGDIADRMLARVKGKINRMGNSTYDATKVFMQQILSSDDTDFLDELMKYIFMKASSESAYCPLYARLLHELGDEFPHFRVIINTIFRDYIGAFKEVETEEPDAADESYKAFVESQERKRGRRGYSQFVAELVKLGEVDRADFAVLLQQIVAVIEAQYTSADKTLVCEEYIDCFAKMCNSASAILRTADYSADLIARLAAISGKSKADSPGISNKARFALMDLSDAAARGWR